MKDNIGLYRRNGKEVYIKQPEYRELLFVSKLWSDEETMKDIGGVFNFPESKWDMFYRKMVKPSDGKNLYFLVYTIRDKAIGEVSFHGFDSATRIARFNVKIHHRYRNKGYGEEAVRLLLEYYFLEFGGEMIMDNISTEAGIKVATKLGFKALRKYKDETPVRISRNEFLEHKQASKKNIAVLLYNGMSLTDYTLTLDILNKANVIDENNILNLYGVSFEEQIITEEGITINTEKNIEDAEKPNTLILPSGINIDALTKNNEFIKYILSNFNNCDYILAHDSAIKLLVRCRSLDGIYIPYKQAKDNEIDEEFRNKLQDVDFIDNGKIMLSSNRIGQIDMLLRLVNKLRGNNLANELGKEIGR